MAKPTPYFVEWVNVAKLAKAPADSDLDLRDFLELRDFEREQDARVFCEQAPFGALPCLYRRDNIRDVTPAGDPRGLLWDFEEELVSDSADLEVSQ